MKHSVPIERLIPHLPRAGAVWRKCGQALMDLETERDRIEQKLRALREDASRRVKELWSEEEIYRAWTRCDAQDRQKYLGKRVEIPMHYDRWALGDRYGEITAYRTRGAGASDYFLVKMDRDPRGKRVKVWRMDWPYMRVI